MVANPGAEEADVVLELARRYDRERLLACLFTPADERRRLAALILLNAEFARIPELVREPMAGLVRYQWWREQIARTAGGGRAEHPALAVLAEELAGGGIAAGRLLAILEAHAALFEEGGLADEEACELHAARTSGLLQGLSARLLTGGTEAAVRLAEDVGTAYGMTGLLRAAPRLSGRGIDLLPEPGSDLHTARITAILARARERLAGLGGREWRLLDSPTRLLARLAARHCRKLAQPGYHTTASPRAGGDPWLPLRLLLWESLGRGPPRL